MNQANKRQVAGDHYVSGYQHWDFVCEIHMHYLLGCATKYLTRWKKKNGVEDLEKSLHYVQKAKEVGAEIQQTANNIRLFNLFIHENLEGGKEAAEVPALTAIFEGRYDDAIEEINALIGGDAGNDDDED